MEIPAIEVNAPIDPLGVSEGVLQGPEVFAHAGWWQDGPEPGEAGAAVIGGHVHSYQGPAVFFRLRELHPGDLVHVYTADEAVVSFRVVGWSDTPKVSFRSTAYSQRGQSHCSASSRVVGSSTSSASRTATTSSCTRVKV